MNGLAFFVMIAIFSAALSILFLGFPDAFKKWVESPTRTAKLWRTTPIAKMRFMGAIALVICIVSTAASLCHVLH
jgi:hypothetical protein